MSDEGRVFSPEPHWSAGHLPISGLDEWANNYQARKEASMPDLPKWPTDVVDTLRLAKECLLTPSGTPWPVSATTILNRIDAAVASTEEPFTEAEGLHGRWRGMSDQSGRGSSVCRYCNRPIFWHEAAGKWAHIHTGVAPCETRAEPKR